MTIDFASYFLEQEEYEEYMIWAFGEGYEDIQTGMGFLKAWNVLHSSLLLLDPDGSIKEDIPRMMAFWNGEE